MVTESQGCLWNFCKGWEAQASETLETGVQWGHPQGPPFPLCVC